MILRILMYNVSVQLNQIKLTTKKILLAVHKRLVPFISYLYQTMTEAEHNRPNPKFFDNRPSASATEVFGETIRPIVSPYHGVIF